MSTLQRTYFVLSILGFWPVAVAGAAPIVAGQDYLPSVAVQSITLVPGTPFNTGNTPLTVQLTASGSFILNRAAETGNTINFSLNAAHFQGVLPSPLSPLPYQVIAGSPDLTPSTGAITNVVQNPANPGFPAGAPSSFVSGTFNANTFFKLVFPDGTTIYSDPNQAAVFTAALTALPPPAGTVFAGATPINLYLQTGPGFDTTRDPIIGQSFDRTVTVTPVPEPSSLALLALGGFALAGWRRRKMR